MSFRSDRSFPERNLDPPSMGSVKRSQQRGWRSVEGSEVADLVRRARVFREFYGDLAASRLKDQLFEVLR